MDEGTEPALRKALPYGALGRWWGQGTRSALLFRPHWDGLVVTPWLVFVLVSVPLLLAALVERLFVNGPADFYWPALLTNGWFVTTVLAFAAWLAAGDDPHEGPPAAALFALLCAQSLPVLFVWVAVFLPSARGEAPEPDSPLAVLVQALWWAALTWSCAISAKVLWQAHRGRRRARSAAVLLAVAAVPAAHWLIPVRHWYPTRPATEAAKREPDFRLTQRVFEVQSRVQRDALAALGPQRPGVIDVFVITFAPDASAKVFAREGDVVAGVMAERFGARGRTLALANVREAEPRRPWATPENLQRAISRAAALMNPDEDVLFIHLTSHGARDGQLESDLWPLAIDSVTPGALKAWLDDAGIRHRVVSVSACYSGSWIAPLAGDDTLVMTAADADHTSYGCGRRSELTFFGRALFDEALRNTWSFEAAHAQAKAVIETREKQAGKDDGFSNPQIFVGDRIRAHLLRLEAQQSAAATTGSGARPEPAPGPRTRSPRS